MALPSASEDPVDRLDPAVLHHVVHTLGRPDLRPFQRAAITPLMDGEDALLLAPTGGGKTEAACLPILSAMSQQRWSGTSVLFQAAALLLLWGKGWAQAVTPPPQPRRLVAQQLLAVTLQQQRVGDQLWPMQWNGLVPFDASAKPIPRHLVTQGFRTHGAPSGRTLRSPSRVEPRLARAG